MTTIRPVDARPKAFAKRELLRLASALELCGNDEFNLAMRCVRLEQERDDMRRDLIDMRAERDALKAIAVKGGAA